MKKSLLAILPIVLLLTVNKTIAQTSSATTVMKPHHNQNLAGNTNQLPIAPHQHRTTLTRKQAVANEPRDAQKLEKIFTKNMSLTEDQHKAVYAACLKYAHKYNEQKGNKNATAEMRAKTKAEFEANVKAITGSGK